MFKGPKTAATPAAPSPAPSKPSAVVPQVVDEPPVAQPPAKRRKVGLTKKATAEDEDHFPVAADDVPISKLAPKKQVGKGFVPPKSLHETTASTTTSTAKTKAKFSAPSSKRAKLAGWKHEELYFADPEICEEMLKQGSAPARRIIIPNKFTDLQQYKRVHMVCSCLAS